jgi:phage FluMu gp28-like protein
MERRVTAQLTEQQWAEARAAAMAAIPGEVKAAGLPSVLLPYQAEAVRLLDSVGVEALFVEKSRRIGLTWGLGAYAVLRAARQKAHGGMDVMYISYSREMTREFIDVCAMWARAFDSAAGAVEEMLFDQGDDGKAINAFRIKFASGFEIMALSSSPRGLRGKQGVVIIDEAAFVDDLSALLKSAMAFLMWGGQVVVCSTHLGAENPFNAEIQDILAGRSPYAHMRIDLDQALEQGLYRRIALVKGETWTPEGEARWRQKILDFYRDNADEELYCIPSMSSGAWLPAPLIEARMTEPGKVLRLDLPQDFLHRTKLEQTLLLAPFMFEVVDACKALDLKPQYAFGFDFGRVADLSTGSLLAIERQLKRREALTFELRGVPGEEQKAIVRQVLKAVRSRLIGAAFDATGMGWTVAEDMGREFGLREDPESGAGLIMPVKFTEEWYRLNMPPLKTAFEDDMIALVADAEHLGDLRMIKVIRGTARVPDLRTGETGKRRHGDYGIALALAHWASRMRWVEYGYTAAALPRETTGSDLRMTAEEDDVRDIYAPPLGHRIRGYI